MNNFLWKLFHLNMLFNAHDYIPEGYECYKVLWKGNNDAMVVKYCPFLTQEFNGAMMCQYNNIELNSGVEKTCGKNV